MGKEREYPLWLWWMSPSERQQLGQPKGTDEQGQPHEPIEIPVPKRRLLDRLLGRAEKTYPSRSPATPRQTDTPDTWIDIS